MNENARASAWRRVYLVRHGATDYGVGGREGAIPGTHLTATGQEQVRELARLLRGLEFDLVVSSPLGRARESAEILVEGRRREIELVSSFQEIVPGDLGNMDLSQVFRAVSSFFTHRATTWDTPYLGGETYRQLRERVVGALEEIVAGRAWTRALIVAHGGVNNALLGWALGVAEPYLPAIEQDFACLNIVDFVEGRPVVRLVNFTAYDAVKAGLECSSLEVMRQVLEEAFGVGLGGDEKT